MSAGLNVSDNTNLAKLLTESAKYDLSNKATSAIVKENGKTYKAAYFSAIVRSDNIQLGIDEISKIINDLSCQGLIHSCLVPISSMPLLRMPLSVNRSAVFCFVLLIDDAHEQLKAKYSDFYTAEGGIGKSLDSDIPDLKDGEFLAGISIPYYLSFSTEESGINEHVQGQIRAYLAILPRGTKVLNIEKLPVMDLFNSYEVKFYNPLLKDIKFVGFNDVRRVEPLDDKLEEFSLITEILYFNDKRERLYK